MGHEKIGGKYDQDKYVALQLGAFCPIEQWKRIPLSIPKIDREEIVVLLHNRNHCRAKITDRNFSNYKIDDGYIYCGKFTDRKRLKELYTFNGGCEGSGSGYCCNNQGSHYIPLHAVLIKKS